MAIERKPAAHGARDVPGAVLWWERLHPALQIAIVFPLSVVVLWVVHVGPLNQPPGRALGYAVFWSVLSTGLIVGASRAEHARREAARARQEEPPRRT